MPNYKNMYYTLFNKVTDIIDDLQKVQQQTEEMYIQEENTIKVYPTKKTKDDNCN